MTGSDGVLAVTQEVCEVDRVPEARVDLDSGSLILPGPAQRATIAPPTSLCAMNHPISDPSRPAAVAPAVAAVAHATLVCGRSTGRSDLLVMGNHCYV